MPASRRARLDRDAIVAAAERVAAAEVLAAVAAANDARRMAEALRSARPFDSRACLGELRVPTLVVAGGRDWVVSPRQATVLAGGIPNARLHCLVDGGHELVLSHAAELAELLRDWLNEIDRPRELARMA